MFQLAPGCFVYLDDVKYISQLETTGVITVHLGNETVTIPPAPGDLASATLRYAQMLDAIEAYLQEYRHRRFARYDNRLINERLCNGVWVKPTEIGNYRVVLSFAKLNPIEIGQGDQETCITCAEGIRAALVTSR